jgi:hypothetical protein
MFVPPVVTLVLAPELPPTSAAPLEFAAPPVLTLPPVLVLGVAVVLAPPVAGAPPPLDPPAPLSPDALLFELEQPGRLAASTMNSITDRRPLPSVIGLGYLCGETKADGVRTLGTMKGEVYPNFQRRKSGALKFP